MSTRSATVDFGRATIIARRRESVGRRVSKPERDRTADRAWLYMLSGDLPSALETLKPGTGSEKGVTPRISELLTTCVALDPSLWRAALGTALAGGTIGRRLHTALAILTARGRGDPNE